MKDLHIYLKERATKRGRFRDIFHLLNHCSNSFSRPGPKLHCVCHINDKRQGLGLLSDTFLDILAETQMRKGMLRIQSITPSWDVGLAGGYLICHSTTQHNPNTTQREFLPFGLLL